MISRISGPIPTHEVYESCQRLKTFHIPDASSSLNGSAAPRIVDALQWHTSTAFNRIQSVKNRHSAKKNHVRDNIRKAKLQQEIQRQPTCSPAARKVPYSAAFVPVDDSTKSTTDERVQTALPPKAYNNRSRNTVICNNRRTHMMKASESSTDCTMTDECAYHREKFTDFQGHKRSTISSEETNSGVECLLGGGKTRYQEQAVYPYSLLNSPDAFESRKHLDGARPMKRSRVCCRATQCSSPQLRRSSRGVQTDIVLSRLAAKRSTSPSDASADGYVDQVDQKIMPFDANPGIQPRSFSVERRPSLLNMRCTTPQRDFMRAHAKGLGKAQELQHLSKMPIRKVSRSPRPEQLTVPKASIAKKVNLIRRDINFVRANAHLATVPPTRWDSARTGTGLSESPSPLGLLSASRRTASASGPGGDARFGKWPQRKLPVGVLPNYLVKRRQAALAAIAQNEANRPDPDQPPGHHRMPDGERMATLEMLRQAQQDLTQELSRLPIRNDTLRLRNRRVEIENRLVDIEQAINIFNKPKVYIRPE